MVRVRRGYPAGPGKTPEISDWQPIYRFSRQRHAGSPGIRERRAPREVRGTGGYSQPVRVDTGERLADGGGCTCAVPVVVKEPHRTRARRLSCCRRALSSLKGRGLVNWVVDLWFCWLSASVLAASGKDRGQDAAPAA